MVHIVQENELIQLVLGIGVAIFLFIKRNELEKIPSIKILIISYCFLVVSYIATITEGFFLHDLQNNIEHFTDMMCSVFFVWWIYKVARKKEI